MPPLVYSTELARSIALAKARAVGGGADAAIPSPTVATDLIYGLVNVRTDGKSILCATKEETGSDFDINVFKAGMSPTGQA
jgi:hypothetical protein